MVIDDEPLICQLLHYQLSDAGYEVHTFQSGQAALLSLARSQPDLVLLDVMMPEISGYDLCRQIRAFSQVPVIMLTAKQADDDVVAGLTIGADDYIGKPFHAPQLIARVEAVLRRAASPARPAGRPQRASTPAALVQRSPAPAASPTRPAAPAVAPQPRQGPQLSEARRLRGLSLYDAGQACGVRWEFLQAIEQEQFSYVPRADLRHALHSYSAWLAVDLQPYRRPQARRRITRERLAMAALLTILLVLTLAVLFI
jgi:CheY-like chemotaxis protein